MGPKVLPSENLDIVCARVPLEMTRGGYTCTEKNILSGGMPHDETDSSLMSYQVDDRFVEVAIESDVWNLPHFDGAVLAGAGNHVVIVWTPLNIEHCSAVACHQRRVAVYPTHLQFSHTHTHTHTHFVA